MTSGCILAVSPDRPRVGARVVARSGARSRASSVASLGVALALGACGGDGGATPIDAPIDTPPGMCGAGAVFTGENINWLSTETSFCGVLGAKWTVRGDASATATTTTPPNGRFVLCVPRQAQTIVDITPPTAASACGSDRTPYPRRGIAIASDAVIAADGGFSARAMTQGQETAMFTQIGAAYNAAQAQLVVHLDGTRRAVSISANHATAQQFNGTGWQAYPDTSTPVGSDLWFPNVDPGAVQITVAGGAVGATAFTLEADRVTYVALIAH